MLPTTLRDALSTLTEALGASPRIEGALYARWRAASSGAGEDVDSVELPGDVRDAADALDRAMPTLTRSQSGLTDLGALFGSPAGEIVFTWCAASAARRDARMARLLASA
ncbi:MAG: hypothetical protein M3Y87_37475, partial [Myxococcota bacterium]|nr:hypothetical protein [Myxococcota bacterium]